MKTKNCSKSNCIIVNPQPLENFHKNVGTKDGLSFVCKTCKKANEIEYRKTHKEELKIRSKKQREKNPGYSREWRLKNPEKFKANQKRSKDKNRKEIRKKGLEYYYKNREKQLALAKKRRDENPEKERARCQKHRKENKGASNARTARYRAKKINATPPWLTKAHKKQIQTFYDEAAKKIEETGISHHVDHIFPLQGKTISGLHVPWNLRVILGSENESKNNRLKKEDLKNHKEFVMKLTNKNRPSS